MFSAVRAAEESLRMALLDLDPDAVPLCDASELWQTFGAVAVLATSGQTLMARRVEEANTWRRAGYRSAEEQLAALSGTSVTAAKNALETSKRVAKLPDTAAAMRDGQLSVAKAEAIASAATIAPDAEFSLLAGAEKKPLAELREACLQAKAVDVDRAHARIRRDRRAQEYIDAEGAWNIHARGPIDDGARFRAAWKARIDEQFKRAKAEGREEPLTAYAFDALIELAEQAGGALPAQAEPNKTTTKRTPANHVALIRLDHAALTRGAIEGEELCEIVGLGPIPVRIARELLGDAILKLVITKGVDVANITHLGRSPTTAQRIALSWLSPACTVVGCTRTQRLENDHRYEWAKTKQTKLCELDPLCKHHHDLKTHKGWALIQGTGPRPMVPPDDPRHPNCRPPPDTE